MANRSVRPIRIDGNVAYVPLTKGYEAIIDASDVFSIGQWKWRASVARGKVYAARSAPRDETGKQRNIMLHRCILAAPEGLEVDHINGNTFDNRRCNLRIADHAQNIQNSAIRSDNKSGYKGVCWHKSNRVWQAKIKVRGRQLHLGYFATAKDAAAAYASAANLHHGDFARVA